MNKNEKQNMLNQLLFSATARECASFREKLVSLGADVNFRRNGESVIQYLVENSYYLNNRSRIHPYFTFLLEHGAEINEQLLFPFANQGELPAIELLVSKGMDLHALDHNRNNLLHIARDNDQYLLIEYLLEQGLNVNELNLDGNPPFATNRSLQNIHMLKKLESYGFNIHQTFKYGSLLQYVETDPICMRYLISKGLDPMERNDCKKPVLMHIFDDYSSYTQEFLISLLDKFIQEDQQVNAIE